MKVNRKNQVLWTMKILVVYFMFYLLCQRGFIILHNSKEWAWDLFLFGFIIILIAGCFYLKRIIISTVAGYIIGFICGILFNKDGADLGGGRTNNAWVIWTLSFLVIIITGVIWEVVDKRIKGDGHNK